MYEVLRYIDDSIYDKLSLNDVATKFGYSKWYFCTLFKKYTGKSFVAYIKDKRMQRALIEILNNKSITDTALRYGYESVGGFNKAFLTEFGCYPSEIKKETIKNYIEYKERRDSQ